MNFNTSHVTVYRPLQAHRFFHHTFQYIPCYGLSRPDYFVLGENVISIHPMLRFIQWPVKSQKGGNQFQYIPCYGLSGCHYGWYNTHNRISIHPMLRFILIGLTKQVPVLIISIHPMLRFIKTLTFFSSSLFKFQYIPCYGLSAQKYSFQHGEFQFQYIPCYGLSRRVKEGEILLVIFQYIPCYGLSNDFKPFLSWHLSSFPLFYVISTFFTSRL